MAETFSESNDNGQAKEEIKLDCQIETLYSKLEEELQISTALKDTSKTLPKDCLESMREVAEKLKEDDWVYPSVNKLLGLQ